MATYEQMLESLPELEGHWEGAHEAEWEDELTQEYEDELTPEFEDEYEGEEFLGTPARGSGGLFRDGEREDERSNEYEDEFSHEFSQEAGYEIAHEGEAEAEAFFGKLAQVAQRAVTPTALQELARNAARNAMRAGLSGA